MNSLRCYPFCVLCWDSLCQETGTLSAIKVICYKNQNCASCTLKCEEFTQLLPLNMLHVMIISNISVTWTLIKSLDISGHQHWVLCLAWSPDGRKLASGCKGGKVRSAWLCLLYGFQCYSNNCFTLNQNITWQLC